MGRTVGELETTMSHREMMDWTRFEATASPLPDRLADIHFSRVSSLIVNAVRSSESPPVSTGDFLIIRDRHAEPDDDDDDGRSEAERLQAVWRGG